MYSTPAIDYLIRKNALRKNKFVIKNKIIIASYATFAAYLVFRYLGTELLSVARTMAHIEPIVYAAISAIIYSVYKMTLKRS